MLLEVKELNTFYDQSHILQGVSLGVDRGEIVCLLGRNGVGKSTTLKSIIGLVTPRSGEIIFKSQNVAGLPPYTIAKMGVGYVPEDRRIFPTLSVRENLIMGIKPGQKSNGDGWSIEKVYKYFPMLEKRDNQRGAHLSGGEQQMLTIARTLMGSPDLILLDEPTEGLAPIMVMEVMKIIKELKEKGETILLVEQNSTLALSVSQRAYILENGHVVYAGPAEELARNAEVKQRYLGI